MLFCFRPVLAWRNYFQAFLVSTEACKGHTRYELENARCELQICELQKCELQKCEFQISLRLQFWELSLGAVLLRLRKKTHLKRRPVFRWKIFTVSKFCAIQGSNLIGYLWGCVINSQSEITSFCTELSCFCIELPLFCIVTRKLHFS